MIGYGIAIGLATAVMTGAVIYENRKERASWRRLEHAIERLRSAGQEKTCPTC